MSKKDDTLRLEARQEAATHRIDAELALDAPPDAVWRALTEAEELMRWFPLEAEVEPEVGGALRLSWGEGIEGDLPITGWDPGRHLRLDWPIPVPEGAEPAPDTVVDYRIEARDGGGTTLRMVHSGFPRGDEWDDIFDSHRRGWRFELRSLRQYLTHHRGKDRRVARIQRSIAPLDASAAWTLLWSEAGLGTGGAPGAGPYGLELPSGHRIAGRVMVVEPPTDLGATVEAVDGLRGAENGLLRVSIESWCGPTGETELHLWLTTWGTAIEDVAAIEASWIRMADRMLRHAAA